MHWIVPLSRVQFIFFHVNQRTVPRNYLMGECNRKICRDNYQKSNGTMNLDQKSPRKPLWIVQKLKVLYRSNPVRFRTHWIESIEVMTTPKRRKNALFELRLGSIQPKGICRNLKSKSIEEGACGAVPSLTSPFPNKKSIPLGPVNWYQRSLLGRSDGLIHRVPLTSHCIWQIRIQYFYDLQMKSNAWHIPRVGLMSADTTTNVIWKRKLLISNK